MPLARNRPKALNIGIIENPNRLAPMVAQRLLKIETAQSLGSEIGCRDHSAVSDITGETDRDPVKFSERRRCLANRLHQNIRSDRLGRGRYPLPIANDLPGFVEQDSLDAAAADIDRERAQVGHDPPLRLAVRLPRP